MATKPKQNNTWMPLAISLSLVAGIVLGALMGNPFARNNMANSDRKLNTILNLISQEYVDDTVNVNDLVERSIPAILANLDPHSSYLTVQSLKEANEDLGGSFSGIGVSFQVINDTVTVMEVIPGGPSDKAGLLPGDKIVSVDGKDFVGPKVDANAVRSRLRGDKGTKVKVGVNRDTSTKTLTYLITRGDVPVNSVDAAYSIEKGVGYVKVNQFGRNTYDEFVKGLQQLKTEGAKRFIVDLRGNGGGYMEIAILMVNEFLPANQLIVSTKGRYRRDDSAIYSDGRGQFQDAELVVLIDEFSASASEIFAGAIQDHDRGLIVGCRSFGKGLVQKQIDLPDHSAVRLTIARYYTPSGRCIQKPYDHNGRGYDDELLSRYSNGELYSRDSIKIDRTKIFTTSTGRKVYGGGGIIPDIFVPRDTTGLSSYYFQAFNSGAVQQFAFNYVQNNRSRLKSMKDYKQLLRNMPSNDDLLNSFVEFAAQKGVPARWYYINQSRDLLTTQLKALIARDLFGQEAYYPIYNRSDKVVEAALKALNRHKAAFPITDN